MRPLVLLPITMEQVLGMALLLASTVSCQTGERIIGGTECLAHSQPWQVFLYTSKLSRCGGALIDTFWVLTAAHCWRRGLTVHIGEHDLRKHDDGEQSSKVAKLIRHPEYEPNTLKNDIMLVRLDTPAILGEYVKTVPVAKECIPVGAKCVVSGWGTTTFPAVNYAYRLQCLEISILSKNICNATYGSLFNDNHICAGAIEGGKDSCRGDSGSSLVCNGTLHGVVSWGPKNCGEKNKPAAYTEICKFSKWIEETMQIN
ncbi:trypsin [Anolis carolinensis]|uniref:Peptidase S1 domain-containing protein n=1 Tax=Anolis carolinensis TaxID=28377 RepID=H9GNQ6_ANOCA|nr:PREDICTED: trypsin [Anolis carolinensis]|eukprot:XP_003225001.2 PREDICTED: trypsin [Anolis carolinensis]